LKRRGFIKRTARYYKEYENKKKELIRLDRQAKKEGNFFVKPEHKVAFVVRIRGINKIDPKSRTILKLLRLHQIHNGVFIKVNKATMNMVRRVEPYVTYGYLSLKTVRDLIYKRGHVKFNGQRIRIQDNDVIENKLGRYGIRCIEDLIHEIYTCGRNFKRANNFLWPFKLSSPRGGYVKKGIHFQEGGDYGNREEMLSQFVARMN
jgi:large subunit ribosomal protein L7e